MKVESANLAASVHQRLLNQSKARRLDFNLLLTRYAMERFLYRLSLSPYAGQFVLKGAMMLQIWLPETGRPTRDLDLLGFGDLTADRLREVFAAICDQPVESDGVNLLADSVTVQAIRSQDEYGGQRVMLEGFLGSAHLHIQVDVGIGDHLTPPAEWIEYPVLLDLPRPRLRAYRPETSIAEKLHAMVVLDLQNSRMKDFFDLLRLAQSLSFTGDVLVAAVRDTFARRKTAMPPEPPTALTPVFAEDPTKVLQWKAFRNRSGLRPVEEDLASVIEMLTQFLGPVLEAARLRSPFPMIWPPGGPWMTYGDTESFQPPDDLAQPEPRTLLEAAGRR
jgi:hypothetical protein